MTPKFDQYINSILLKESPDNFTLDGKNVHYYTGYLTGLIPNHKKDIFLLFNDEAITRDMRDDGSDYVGHGAFISRLYRGRSEERFAFLEKNAKTNGNLRDWVGRDDQSYVKYRIFPPQKVLSFWNFPSKEVFNTAVESAKAVGLDPNELKYDCDLDGSTAPDNLDTAQAIKNKPHDTPMLTFDFMRQYFNKLTPDQDIQKKEEEEKKLRDQADLERQIKLRALGFSGPTKKPWQM